MEILHRLHHVFFKSRKHYVAVMKWQCGAWESQTACDGSVRDRMELKWGRMFFICLDASHKLFDAIFVAPFQYFQKTWEWKSNSLHLPFFRFVTTRQQQLLRGTPFSFSLCLLATILVLPPSFSEQGYTVLKHPSLNLPIQGKRHGEAILCHALNWVSNSVQLHIFGGIPQRHKEIVQTVRIYLLWCDNAKHQTIVLPCCIFLFHKTDVALVVKVSLQNNVQTEDFGSVRIGLSVLRFSDCQCVHVCVSS